MSIEQNLREVEENIGKYCAAAGVPPESVHLVAVSKTIGAEQVREAYNAGQRMFGENRIQEYVEKSKILEKNIQWNLIGRLQTNKVKYIIDNNVFLLHSLDRMSLAYELQKECVKKDSRIDVLLQLNLSLEETKAGLFAQDVDQFLEETEKLDRVHVKGIMTIGPNVGDEGKIRKVFSQAKVIYDRLCGQLPDIEYLSMGMSHDYGWAILEGANMVRVGTAIFGKRDYSV